MKILMALILWWQLMTIQAVHKLMPIKLAYFGKTINLTSDWIDIRRNNFIVDDEGTMTCKNAIVKDGVINGGQIFLKSSNDTSYSAYIEIQNESEPNEKSALGSRFLSLKCPDGEGEISATTGNSDDSGYSPQLSLTRASGGMTWIEAGYIWADEISQGSLEGRKKNFEKLDNGLEIIKNTDIYKYNLKSQKDTDKKHIGFVIGDNYNYSEEITNRNNDGVDTYSMISVAYKAIQELAEENRELKARIEVLEKGENNGEN